MKILSLKEVKCPPLPPLDWKGPHEEEVFVARDIGEVVTGYFVPYRYLFAYTQDPSIRNALSFIPVGVNGLVKKDGKVLFGKRGKGVTQFPGWWELPPSGAISREIGGEKLALSASGHLLRELTEETGITQVTKVTPILQWLNQKLGRLELCYQIDVREDPKETEEYTEFQWLHPGEAIATIGSEIVPLSELLFMKYGSL